MGDSGSMRSAALTKYTIGIHAASIADLSRSALFISPYSCLGASASVTSPSGGPPGARVATICRHCDAVGAAFSCAVYA